jgi:hypothetical protein
MRGNTLEDIRNQVANECGSSTAFSRSTDVRGYYDQIIKRVYETLYDDYEWPFQRVKKEDAGVVLQLGERYYDFPLQLKIERISEVWRKYGNVWGKLTQGILPEDYTAMDSDANYRADPALKWDVYSPTQFEVWPIPASTGDEIRFDGYKTFTPLNTEGALCDLDDRLVVLHAAAEILAEKDSKRAMAKAAAAQRRLISLRGQLATKTRIGYGRNPNQEGRTGPLRIRVPLVRS